MKIPQLYKEYFIDKSDERKMLFKELANRYNPERGFYPGSFVHITPSFYIRDMTYVDSDRRISKFFNDVKIIEYIREQKEYKGEPEMTGLQADYSSELPIKHQSFDIMFSFYAGFISKDCKKYLKNGAVLVCNNSHGDSSLAYTDPDYELIGVVTRRGSRFKIITNDLGAYFQKKDGSPIDTEKVMKRMVGENFTKKAFAYIFRYKKQRQ